MKLLMQDVFCVRYKWAFRWPRDSVTIKTIRSIEVYLRDPPHLIQMRQQARCAARTSFSVALACALTSPDAVTRSTTVLMGQMRGVVVSGQRPPPPPPPLFSPFPPLPPPHPVSIDLFDLLAGLRSVRAIAVCIAGFGAAVVCFFAEDLL